MSSPDDLIFDGFRTELSRLRSDLRKSNAERETAAGHKASARSLVQTWFRKVRPLLMAGGMLETDVLELDSIMQSLLPLANGKSRRTTYVRYLDAADAQVARLEINREMLLGAQVQSAVGDGAPSLTAVENRIIQILDELVPSAALSYRQAIADMADDRRVSLRGTANELRSVLWDVLDRLAPDEAVQSASGFKLEKDRTKPTQKQKTRFILKSRLGDSARKAPETTIDLIEERIGALTRSLYDRSSMSTHLVTAQAEVEQLKMYVDTVLAELLEIHHA